MGAIFSSLFESGANVLDGQEDFAFFTRFLGHTLSETFAIGLPAAFGPGIEAYANKSAFTGRPIESMAQQRLPAGERANPWTPELLKDLGRGLKISPVMLEHVIRGHTATFGALFLTVADTFYQITTDAPPRPSPTIEDVPAIGRFVRGEEGRTKYATRYYEFAREVHELSATLANYQKLGSFEQARQLVRESKDKLRYRAFVNQVNEHLSAYRKQEHRIWADPGLTPQQKRDKLTEFGRRKNELYRKAYERIARANR